MAFISTWATGLVGTGVAAVASGGGESMAGNQK
jgi:hypothetical protein